MAMRPAVLLSSLLATVAVAAVAQHPMRHPVDAIEARFARSHPVVQYALRVDSSDLSGFAVEMRIRNAPDTFRLAMSAHPEYDDRFWRYVEALRIESSAGRTTIERVDSAVWRVHAQGGEAIVRYRIRLPMPQESPRAAWRPFLSPTGGLFGGPHSFMYVVGATLAPAHLALDVPRSWEVATGLTPTSDPRTFFAPTFDVLVEGPVFAGRAMTWRFAVDGVPHRVVYWPGPNAVAFDTTAFVHGVRRMTEQSIALFGRAPWREYTFIFQDNAYGGLEHANSVTLGAPSEMLARNPHAALAETAHEFIHAWNLMRIRPAEYRTVDYRTQPPTAGLWFSEGLTIFYADLALRRAGLPTNDSTRTAHLASTIARYLANPGNARFSAERVSQAAYNAGPGALGDYVASTHLQGELIGAMLDLVIRDASAGTRSMDDVMRLMLERFSGVQGFVGRDVERAVEDVCGCDVTPFFDAHVRGGSAIDFDRHLALIGLRAQVTWTPATGQDNQPTVDLRVYSVDPQGGGRASLVVTNPESSWGRAGLHTGDRLVAVNDAPVGTWREFRAVLQRIRVGDTTRVEVERAGRRVTAAVIASQLSRPVVRLEELANAPAKPATLRSAWLRGR